MKHFQDFHVVRSESGCTQDQKLSNWALNLTNQVMGAAKRTHERPRFAHLLGKPPFRRNISKCCRILVLETFWKHFQNFRVVQSESERTQDRKLSEQTLSLANQVMGAA